MKKIISVSVVSIALVVSCSLSVNARSGGKSFALHELEKGIQLTDDSKASQALVHLKLAARELPFEPVAQLALADALINLNKPAEAISHLNKAMSRDAQLKNFGGIHGRLGLCYLQSHDPKRASAELALSLRANQLDYLRWSDWVDYNNLVSAKQLLRDYAGAQSLKALAQALKIENTVRKKREELDFKTAVTLADKLVKTKPELLNSHLLRGVVLLDGGAHKRALEDFSYIIRAQPRCALPYYFRADCYSDLFDFENAIKDYSAIIALQPQVVAATDTAETGRCKNLGETYDETLVSLADIYYLRASALRRLKRAKQALTDIEMCLKLNADDVDAHVLKADILAFSGNAEAALKELEGALVKDPKNQNSLELLTQTYERLAQYDRALVTANRLIKITKDEPQAYACRASVYGKMANWPGCIADYSKALKDEESKELYKQRGNAYLASGQSEKAVSDYTAAMKCAGHADKELLYLRSIAYQKMGKIDLASKDRQARKD